MTMRYRLVFRGKYLPGMARDDVAANVAELFRVPLGRACDLLDQVPAVIKQNIDVDQGNRYLEALANAGLVSHLEPATDSAGLPLPLTWDGVERRRVPERRLGADRRGGSRHDALRPERRISGDRRKAGH